MRPSIVSSLYGRERELRVVAGLIGGLAEGTGGVLVVRGEAGIAKSALLAAAAGLAADSGARVLSATGIQAEARLPFAGLHQLLRPVLGYAVLPEGTARFYHRRDLRYVHVAGLDDIEVALAQHKARPCRNSTGSRALRSVSSAVSPKRAATARSGCPQDR